MLPSSSHLGFRENMNKLLFLGIWMSFSIAMAVGVRCFHCLYHKDDLGCLRPKLPCKADKNSACFRQTVFRGSLLVYTMMGCAWNCQNVTEGSQKLKQVVSCCKSRNFCNV